jgi:hypothetical protein
MTNPEETRTLLGQLRRLGAIPPRLASAHFVDEIEDTWWAHQDSNLGPTDYESAALTD